MLDSKICLIVVLGGNIDVPFPMDLIHFLEQGGICALKIQEKRRVKTHLSFLHDIFMRYKEDRDLGEVALLINKRQHVQGFVGQYVQGALVVFVVYFLPHNVFTGILVLLQFENMLDEELLQLLIGKVDAQLLKAATVQQMQQHKRKERWVDFRQCLN